MYEYIWTMHQKGQARQAPHTTNKLDMIKLFHYQIRHLMETSSNKPKQDHIAIHQNN